MTALAIVQIGHPVLRQRAREVRDDELDSAELHRICADLVETMRAANGAGLGAPQVDIPLRIFTVEVGDNPRYPYKPTAGLRVLVNPVVRPVGDETYGSYEGCLSIPDLRGLLPRATEVEVASSTRRCERTERFGGLSAGTMQHELDHLDGVLFPDRVEDQDDALHLGDVSHLSSGRMGREHPAAAGALPRRGRRRMSSPLRASVVVMTIDRPAQLRRCLASLAAQSLPSDSFEVIVVDASATPGEQVGASWPELRVTHRLGANLGVAGNRNTGVELARSPVVAFLDDDCVAETSWLERLTVAVEARPGCLAGGLVANPYPTNAVAVAGQIITEGVYDFFNPSGQEPRFFPGSTSPSTVSGTWRSAAATRGSAASRRRIAISSTAGDSPEAPSSAVPVRSCTTSIARRSRALSGSTSTTVAGHGATTASAASAGAGRWSTI